MGGMFGRSVSDDPIGTDESTGYPMPGYLELVYQGSVTGTLPDGTALTRGIWFFAVPDGETTSIMLSMEHKGGLYVGRLDLSSFDPTDLATACAAVRWVEVVGAGGHVADHFHIFAHGRHWLLWQEGLYDSAGNDTGYGVNNLCRFSDTGLSDYQAVAVATNSPNSIVKAMLHNEHLQTNDPFVVETGWGVAVGLGTFDTPWGSPIEVLEVARSLSSFSAEWFSYRNTPPVNTMGSAQRVASTSRLGAARYHVVTTRYIDPVSADKWHAYGSGIDYGIVDTDWQHYGSPPAPVVRVEPAEGDNLIKPTLVRFTNGWFAITYLYGDYSITTGASSATKKVVAYHVCRKLYTSTRTLMRTRRLYKADENCTAGRPFSTTSGGHLLTCWDEWDVSPTGPIGLGLRLRVEAIPSFLL